MNWLGPAVLVFAIIIFVVFALSGGKISEENSQKSKKKTNLVKATKEGLEKDKVPLNFWMRLLGQEQKEMALERQLKLAAAVSDKKNTSRFELPIRLPGDTTLLVVVLGALFLVCLVLYGGAYSAGMIKSTPKIASGEAVPYEGSFMVAKEQNLAVINGASSNPFFNGYLDISAKQLICKNTSFIIPLNGNGQVFISNINGGKVKVEIKNTPSGNLLQVDCRGDQLLLIAQSQ